uniref:Transposase n=1 Tax=Magnetococcus massalia (strain MO-1) TaxID=451514 RepID=A0A1S7LKZ1_MAGMO
MKEHIAPGVINPFSGGEWFDPLAEVVRLRIRTFTASMVEEELITAREGRERYQRKGSSKGKRNGHRDRPLIGRFGPVTVSLPWARIVDENGHELEWKSEMVPAYKRVIKRAETKNWGGK